jgi:hypothetical protein
LHTFSDVSSYLWNKTAIFNERELEFTYQMFVPISDSQISTYNTHFCNFYIFLELENENAMPLHGYNMQINGSNNLYGKKGRAKKIGHMYFEIWHMGPTCYIVFCDIAFLKQMFSN